MSYEFKMPWAPSINSYWATFKNRRIISKKGREYKKEVIQIMRDLGLHGEMLDGRLSVTMTLNPPTLRKYDVDNFTKALFDGLTHSEFWVDDEQVDSLTIKKGEKIKGGNVIVKVELR